MKVTHITSTDLSGCRSHGYDLLAGLAQRNIEAEMLVLYKKSTNPKVFSLETQGTSTLRFALNRLEVELGISNLLYPWGASVMAHPGFQRADIVHHHSIHDFMISVQDYPALFSKKPTVWTVHDQWLGTGHCMYPRECENYLSSCHICPQLDDMRFTLAFENAEENRRSKAHFVKQINPYIVISTNFMADFLKKSPITQHFHKITKIPFGIDLQEFGTFDQASCRQDFGIPPGQYVIGFRAQARVDKGTQFILEALGMLAEKQNVTLVTVDDMALPPEIQEKYAVVELGTRSGQDVAKFFGSLDLFLMPSIAESFGMMGIEAMASSVPVVVFQDTVLAEVTYAPDCGLAVEYGSSRGLAEAISHLIAYPEEGKHRGALGRKLAEEHYTFQRYADDHQKLYETIWEQEQREPSPH